MLIEIRVSPHAQRQLPPIDAGLDNEKAHACICQHAGNLTNGLGISQH
jgi:hypothetical protein